MAPPPCDIRPHTRIQEQGAVLREMLSRCTPGKTRGFAFLAYEDQRSTVLAVDNLSGAKVAGRIITVNHVDNYKIKRAEVRAGSL